MAAGHAASLTTIADLPHDCLREVMLRVGVYNRIYLRKVCREWCKVIDDCWSAVKKLQCIDPTERMNGMGGYKDTINIASSSRKIHEGVMKHCGEFLTHLLDDHEKPEIPILQFAAKYCRNIRELGIKVSSKADDKHMNQMLAVNQKLKVLRLDINFKNAKMCLRTIATDVLEDLWIRSEEKNVYPPSILMSQKQIVRKAKSLRNLITYFVDEELIGLIGEKILFKTLDVTYRGNSLKTDTFHPILKLKNLQKLILRAPMMVVGGILQKIPLPITDDFLVALAENLRLLDAMLLDASHVTDRGFSHLASLPKLSQLRVSCCPEVTDKFLYLFSGLEKLDLMECNIRDEGVVRLLEKTQTMRELDLSATLITNETLIAAIKETKKRNNGVVLKLLIWDTDTTPSTITDSSPLLEIIDEEP